MMLDVSEETKDEPAFIDIKVQNPTKELGSYISYEIVLETNDSSFTYTKSSTRRRYSEFSTLTKILSKQLPHNKLPILPPKEPFKSTFDQEFIRKRQDALQDFLRRLVTDRMFLSCKALHLFLQSTFSMTQIKDIIDDKTPVEIHQLNTIFYDGISTTERTNKLSSNESSESNSNICAILKPSSETAMDSAISNRKVNFCDQVTVAEVHIT